MKKTILYLRTDIINEEIVAGGSVTHTLGVIDGFINQKYEITCASTILHNQLKERSIKKIIYLKNPIAIGWLRWKLNSFLSSIFFTLQILRSTNISNCSYIYQRYSILNCTGVLLQKLKKIPLILEYNGSEVWLDKNWSKKKLISFRWLIKKIEKINIFNASYIIVVSKPLKEELIHQGISAKKILINPNGVHPNIYNPEKLTKERQTVRQQLNIENKFVFGFVGTFSIWHGIDTLAAMIPEVIKQNNNTHFLLIGDGPLKQELIEQLKLTNIGNNHVIFTGILPPEKTKSYLAACDAFLSPNKPNLDGSPFFGSPTKLFEYMSMGKPIIASNLGQMSELLQPSYHAHNLHLTEITKKIAILANPIKNHEFIHAALSLTECANTVRKNMGKMARDKVVENYSWNMHVERITHFVEKKEKAHELNR